MATAIRKLILTVEVSEERGQQVEDVLLSVAGKLNGRLTRSVLEPSTLGDGYVIQTSRETLRKLGRDS